jgi:hypothetical protein
MLTTLLQNYSYGDIVAQGSSAQVCVRGCVSVYDLSILNMCVQGLTCSFCMPPLPFSFYASMPLCLYASVQVFEATHRDTGVKYACKVVRRSKHEGGMNDEQVRDTCICKSMCLYVYVYVYVHMCSPA